jgi:hypothetical protein
MENMMLKKIIFTLIGICLGPGIVPAQTGQQTDGMSYALGFSTYLSLTDRFFPQFDVVTDANGFIYISGNTRDRNFPATEGAFQRELKGEADAFVAKFSPDGKVVFATLIGGTKREHHTGITVDSEGYVYVVGGTHSPDFPVTPGAYDTSFNGEGEWAGDVYLAKLDPSGSRVVFATFIGGKVEDTAHSIKIDSKGNIVIGGATCSSDFTATAGVIHGNYSKQASFIAKFGPKGDKLLFSTSLGNGVYEMVTDLAIDDKDNIFATGFTVAADLPVTDNAIRKNLIRPKVGGFENGIDHFLAKINETGTKIQYLSYWGDGGYMSSNIQWASPNRVMISGSTNSDNFPVTDNAVSKKNKGERDAFFAIFNSDDMTLQYSTLLGGSQLDTISKAYFLDKDRIVIGGITNSENFPLTENAMDSAYPATDKLFNSSFLGRRKAFVSVVDITNGQLVYSTFLGACLRFELIPDQSGNLGFMAETGPQGFPGFTDFPLSEDAFQAPPTFLMLGRLALNNNSIKK